jgi:hypothetical protein
LALRYYRRGAGSKVETESAIAPFAPLPLRSAAPLAKPPANLGKSDPALVVHSAYLFLN